MAIPTILDRINRAALAVAGVIATLAGLSLLLDLAPVYDAWAWLVWGREVAGLELDTGAGPSWKPLPVVVTAALSPLGDAAPDAWLLVSRAGWLAAAALAARLGLRLLAGAEAAPRGARWAAAAIAGIGVVLLADPFTPWLRQFAGGLSEPLLVALVLGAVDRGLAARPRQALALAVAACLLRPEAWPFAAAYGAWLWRRGEEAPRPWLAAAAIAVPALWLGPDLVGSGDPLTGAARAREGTGAPPGEALEAIGRAWELAPIALWVAGAYAVAVALRRRDPAIPALAAGALAWIAIVAALAAAGYAGIPRFAAPAGAVVAVLGAVGTVQALAAASRLARTLRARVGAGAVAGVAAAAALAGGLGVEAGIRASDLPGDLDGARAHSKGVAALFALAAELEPEAVERCEAVVTTDFLSRPALAWRLERPIAGVDVRVRSAPPEGLAFASAAAPAATLAAIARRGEELAERGPWTAYAISCASSVRSRAPSGPSARRIAGVTGARR